MNIKLGRLSAGFVLLTLAACGGGSSDDAATDRTPASSSGGASGGSGAGAMADLACESFKAVNPRTNFNIDAGCTACNVSKAELAMDGSLDTAAQLVVNRAAPSQGASVRATAQSGIVFPAGRNAGVYYSVPAGTFQSYSVTIRTLLAGAIQEDSGSDSTVNGIGGGHGRSFSGIATTKSFDAVEVLISNTQSEDKPTFEVFEICSDHH